MTSREFWRHAIPTSLICLLPIAIGLILWDKLPAEMPIHWNAAGEPDNFATRGFCVFAMPGFMCLINLLGHACLRFDARSQNAGRVMLILGRWCAPVLSLICMCMTYAWSLGNEVAIERIVPTLVGVLIAVVGNYLPKCRPSRTVGIRVPWTLRSDENWYRTHRFAGWLYLIGGLVLAVAGFCNFAVLFVAMLPVFLLPIVYSYLLYRRGI